MRSSNKVRHGVSGLGLFRASSLFRGRATLPPCTPLWLPRYRAVTIRFRTTRYHTLPTPLPHVTTRYHTLPHVTTPLPHVTTPFPHVTTSYHTLPHPSHTLTTPLPHPIPSHRIPSHHIPSHPIPPHPIPFHQPTHPPTHPHTHTHTPTRQQHHLTSPLRGGGEYKRGGSPDCPSPLPLFSPSVRCSHSSPFSGDSMTLQRAGTA